MNPAPARRVGEAKEKVVRLDVPVEDLAVVRVLHNVGQLEEELGGGCQGEALTLDEHRLERGPEQLKDQRRPLIVDGVKVEELGNALRDVSRAVEDLVEVELEVELWTVGAGLLKLDGDLLLGEHVEAVVEGAEGS